VHLKFFNREFYKIIYFINNFVIQKKFRINFNEMCILKTEVIRIISCLNEIYISEALNSDYAETAVIVKDKQQKIIIEIDIFRYIALKGHFCNPDDNIETQCKFFARGSCQTS
jgi:hypothetical protein